MNHKTPLLRSFSVSHARRIPASGDPALRVHSFGRHMMLPVGAGHSPRGACDQRAVSGGTPRATPSGAGHFGNLSVNELFRSSPGRRNIRASAATRGSFAQDRADNPCSEGRGRRPLQGFSLLTSRGEQKAWQRETEQFRCRATRCWMLQIPAATRVTMSEQGIDIVSLR